MQLRVMTEPQEGGTYEELLHTAMLAEHLGYDGFFRSDHLQRIDDGDPGPGPTEAWVTLAGLARETQRLRLGTMVTSATFRRPGLLAITVATVDAMSGGRVEFGLGGGWYETEHASYGIPVPPLGDRFDALEEQLQAITGMWASPPGEPYSFNGRHVTITDSPALPKPVQPGGIPIIVGGAGANRTPRLAARFADEFNMPPGSTLRGTRQQFERVRETCERTGRDTDSLVFSTAQGLFVGSDADVASEAERRRTTAERMRERGLVGTPAEILDKLGALAELGSTRTYLQLRHLRDDDGLERVAAEVAPNLP
jgi:F420-dependent oxidoreductase-like protein